MELWRVWAEHCATGDGLTVMALVTYAEDPLQARIAFERRFGPIHARVACVEPGVVETASTRCLFARETLRRVRSGPPWSAFELSGCLHASLC